MLKKTRAIFILILFCQMVQAQSRIFNDDYINLYVPIGRLLNVEKPILSLGLEVRTQKKNGNFH